MSRRKLEAYGVVVVVVVVVLEVGGLEVVVVVDGVVVEVAVAVLVVVHADSARANIPKIVAAITNLSFIFFLLFSTH